MADYQVSEANVATPSVVGGNLSKPGTGFQVLGVAFAGRSLTGVGAGQSFEGFYGAIQIDPAGTFSYALDNTDTDTNRIGTGETATERFTFTFSLNGSVFTEVITFSIAGTDEPDDITYSFSQATLRYGSLIPSNERYEIAGRSLALDTHRDDNVVTVDGTIVVTESGADQLTGVSASTLVNNGRISAISTGTNMQGAFAASGSEILNYGVISLVYPNQTPATHAFAVGANLVNYGLVESVADRALSSGVMLGQFPTHVTNYGVIRSISDMSAVGVEAIGGNVIENHGTIEAVRPGGESIGIHIFPNSTNPYSPTPIVNTGRIVATHVIAATEGYNTSILLVNSGYMEGSYRRDKGNDSVTNLAGGEWRGELKFGYYSSQFLNAGSVVGNVLLEADGDLYDGRGGTVAGQVFGGGGSDVLIGGSAADALLGEADNDSIMGGGGADSLTGGTGADVFVFAPGDSVTGAADTITDFVSGSDRIDLRRLGVTAVQFEVQGGTTFVSGSASTGAFRIGVTGAVAEADLILGSIGASLTGGAAADVLVAAVLDSTIVAGEGDDVLVGSDGADVLDGGVGADLMFGGWGDDEYIVDSGGDRTIDPVDGGHDTLVTYGSYTLYGTIEDGVLLGSGNIDLFANDLANVLTGNSGNNQIIARGGDDTIFSGAGNDTVYGQDGDDTFSGGLGDDYFYGDGGLDTAIFAGNRSAYSWTTAGTTTQIHGPDGNDTLFFVDRLQFANGSYEIRPVGFGWATQALAGFGAAPAAGGWADNDASPRLLANVNNWGNVDIVGFGEDGVYVSLETGGGSFSAPFLALNGFGSSAAAGGWTDNMAQPRMLADVNGDGSTDIVGFGENGVYAALGTGSGTFGSPFLATSGFGSSAASGGWTDNDVAPRLLADLNGDDRADILGFGAGGTYVALATSAGTFAAPFLTSTGYGSSAASGSWTSDGATPRRLADVNGDGFEDLVGFAPSGVYVSLGTGGGAFAAPILAAPGFGSSEASGGWSDSDASPRLLADLNDDGRADIVGFGADGTYVALGEANGTFAAPFRATAGFGANAASGNWTSQTATPRMLADLNGDGILDLVGFGAGGVYGAYGDGGGAFGGAFLANPGFGSSAGSGGWGDSDLHPRMVLDLTADGAADILGFGDSGVIVATSVNDWVLV